MRVTTASVSIKRSLPSPVISRDTCDRWSSLQWIRPMSLRKVIRRGIWVLPTETKVESGTSQRKSGTAVNLSFSGDPNRRGPVSLMPSAPSFETLDDRVRCSVPAQASNPSFQSTRVKRSVGRLANGEAAAERRENHSKGLKGFCLTARAINWP